VDSLLNQFSQIQFASPAWFWLWPLMVIAIALLLRRSRLDPVSALPQPLSTTPYRHPQFHLLRQLIAMSEHKLEARSIKGRLAVYAIALLGIVTALAHP